MGIIWFIQTKQGNAELAKTVAVVVLYLLQSTLTQRTMLLFSCISLGAGADDYFLSSDLSLRCWTGIHLKLVVCLGIPMLLLYVLGIPFGFFVLLYRNQHLVKSIPAGANTEPSQARLTFHQNFGFLWSGFKLNAEGRHAFSVAMFWEVAVVCRKTLLNMVVVFFFFNSHAQAAFGFAVVIIAAAVHGRVYPFAEEWLNHLEMCSLYCTVL